MDDPHELIDRITDAAAAAAAAGFQSHTDGFFESGSRRSHMFLTASELPQHLMRLDTHSIPTSLTYFTEAQSFSPLQSFREKSMLEEVCEQPPNHQQSQRPQQQQQQSQSEHTTPLSHGHSATNIDYQLQTMVAGPLATRLALGVTDQPTSVSYHYYLQADPTQTSAVSSVNHSGTHMSSHDRCDSLGSPRDRSSMTMLESHGPDANRGLSVTLGIRHTMLSSGLLEMDDLPSGEKLESGEGLDAIVLGVGSLCLICGDRATGKHYGAYSCDGCKGFFRRSVRRNHSYTCRQKRQCVVTKDKRNQCRFCRLRKCFRVGMKKSAVQNERDKISNRPLAFDSITSGQSLLDLQQLLTAESRAYSVIQKQQNIDLLTNCSQEFANSALDSNQADTDDKKPRFAEASDICDSIKTQLIFLIEWAKNLPSFGNLPMNDQVALLQSHAGEMLILGAVWRSLTTNGSNRGFCRDNSTNNSMGSRNIAVTSVAQTTESTVAGKHRKKNSMGLSHQTRHVPRPIGWPLVESDVRSQSLSSHTSDSSQTPPPQLASSLSTTVGQQASTLMPARSTVGMEAELTQTEKAVDPFPQLIYLGNSRIISRYSPQPEIAEIANRILDQLYQPMLELCLEDSEIACLRAIIFFDPNCANLSDQGRQVVRACQYQIQTELMHLMNDKLYLPQGRFGALLLLLPDLRSITYRMIDRLQIMKQMGQAHLDGLLSEILLSGCDTSEPKVTRSEDSTLFTSSENINADIYGGDLGTKVLSNTVSPQTSGARMITATNPAPATLRSTTSTPKKRTNISEYSTINNNNVLIPSGVESVSQARHSHPEQSDLIRMIGQESAQSRCTTHLLSPSIMFGTPIHHRYSANSSSTAFSPYLQGHQPVGTQNTNETYLPSSTPHTFRPGWSDFPFGRNHVAASMCDYSYSQPLHTESAGCQNRRFSPTEQEARSSFHHGSQEPFDALSVAPGSFEVTTNPVPMGLSSYETTQYYQTDQTNLQGTSQSNPTDAAERLGLSLLPPSTTTNSSITQTGVVPRLMGNMFSSMFHSEPHAEEHLYPFYHHSNP